MSNKNFWAGDIEARRGLRKKFLLGGLYNGRRYLEFKKEDDFMNFLLKINGIVFFHFLDFDIRFIIDWCQRKKIEIAQAPISVRSKVIEWKIRNVVLRDSFILTQSSLKDLAEAFEIKERKLPIKDYLKLRQGKQLSQYLKNDVIGLYKILKKFYEFIGWQNLNRKTIASIALAKFKEIDKASYQKIIEYPIFAAQDEFIREGFYSAYYKIFDPNITNKNQRILKIDCNSYYGFVMKDNYFPYGPIIRTKKLRTIENLIKEGKLGLIKAKVFSSKRLPMGFLPIKTAKGISYSTKKEFSGVWTSPEIEFAKNLGYEFKFQEAIFWNYKDKLFKRFINFLAKIKERFSGAKREIVKFLLVSFYGKFAQRREIEVFKKVEKPLVHRLYLDKAMTIASEKQKIYIPYFHPEISAFTTSYARIWMWKFCQEVGWKNIYAIIMDSLILKDNLNEDFKRKWFDPNKIGKFKVIAQIEKGIILGRGIYALKGINGKEIIKNQGGLKEYTKLLTFRDFEKAKRKKIWVQYDEKTGIRKPKSIREFLKGKGKLKEMNLVTRKVKIRS